MNLLFRVIPDWVWGKAHSLVPKIVNNSGINVKQSGNFNVGFFASVYDGLGFLNIGALKFNRVGAISTRGNHDTRIDCVKNVLAVGEPFQIRNVIIALIAVLMVNVPLILGIGNKRSGDKLMNAPRLSSPASSTPKNNPSVWIGINGFVPSGEKPAGTWAMI